MLDILFYVFSAITLLSALLMVVSPSAVNGALCMIVAFLGTAALFVLLEAYLLAALQVVVYAGAVMVLFLFIIMLLDVDKGAGASDMKDKVSLGAASMGFALVVILVTTLFIGSGQLPEPELRDTVANPTGATGGFEFSTAMKSFGYSLFTKYMLPFQVAGFLLLAGMVGVIVVSKKPSIELEADTADAGEGDA
ncbi:NADH-quinone oxidoreductase subunit J family protein [Coraliomargarita akajimensis]|uniref:NADH-quinone oxidoreductase subunit J n=1 Tax=Coraliomargarita akajimensis (strain DSM 45221 / IAM 15411 / JCM 23193 / KCTC 12865 / 04OKA010-24) TaxID=583355 RepID=D5EP83_CORAD|nr:NADH-quinone oxidoreductase subunit J [Coraliomargarita akajimensis]ADE55593.1 NADH-ubiquinone/plastoquinone oxidoreductase chain 6 [Coraliomargarita akajimensis DSM 45221]